jgi:hypothetical protein
VDSSQNELNISHNDLFNVCGRAGVLQEAYQYYQQKAEKAGVPVPHGRTVPKKQKSAFAHCMVECGGPDGWKAYVDRLMRSDLCLGKVKPKPGQKYRFIINFDKAIEIDRCVEVLGGKYDNRETGQHNGEVFMYNGMMLVD